MEKMFVDSHCHLDDPDLCGDAQKIINNFDVDNIEFVINNSSDLNSSKNSLDLAKNHKKVFCAVGCHPHEAKTYDAAFEDFLTTACTCDKTVAIGEIGLDYYYNLSPADVQQKVFAQQIRLADSLKLPVILHIRDAWEDTLKILEQNKQYLTNGVLLHCFSGSKEISRILSNRYDAYFAFGGAITFKNFSKADVVADINIERLLTETDCPYMTPVPFRGETNQPKNVALVAQKMAEILNLPLPQLCQQVKQNTLRLFKKISPKL